MNAALSESLLPDANETLLMKVAETDMEIEQAMRLRYQVFVKEEGNMKLANDSRMEKDVFDEYCDHLIVKSSLTDKVVGTYRLLPGPRSAEGAGFYSETEFDLGALNLLRADTLELGRSCIDPEYRNGRVIQMLWEGIAGYCQERGYSHLIGCASMHVGSLRDLNEIYSFLLWKKVITSRFGVSPLPTHRIDGLQWMEVEGREREIMRKLPPLLKGYQWLGAEIGGEPAYDEIFNSIDFLVILDTGKVTRKYRKHFLEK